jgi:hypothetical protein
MKSEKYTNKQSRQGIELAKVETTENKAYE